MADSALLEFLDSRPSSDGIVAISTARSYLHDEADYDRQYGLESFPVGELVAETGHLMDICRRHGYTPGGRVLEIGCGTGRISLGLSQQSDIGHLLITDPSPAFCRIARKKIGTLAPKAGRVDYGILTAEDVSLLPPESLSLIVLRSVLHHIADVDRFLADCARALPSGGLLVCEEPYYDGYMMMGFVGQFIEDALRGAGYPCDDAERELIRHFIETMQFYSRRDIDKSLAEDKHLFRPDELMATGRGLGLVLTHYPNWRMTLSPEANTNNRVGYFQRFFAEYVRYCMDWPPEFSERVASATRKYFQFFEPLESGGNTTPFCFGTFVFAKH